MIVLARKLQQELCIGDDITVRVVKIKNGQVRLGIVAPPNIPIIRPDIERERLRNATQEKP